MGLLTPLAMRIVDTLTAIRLEPTGTDQTPKSRLLLDGHETSAEVPGAVLEAAVDTGDGWLLFLTDDVPHEESLNICLLDRDFRLLDRATLVWPYGTGAFRDLCPVSDRTLQFEFFDDKPWFLDLLDGPQIRVPPFGEPAGVWRPFGFTRRFRVRRREPA